MDTQSTPIMQTPETARAQRARQDWSAGALVHIGGNVYRVTGHAPPARRGEARITHLESTDGETRYIWQPYRGLRIVGPDGKPVRRRRKRGKRAARSSGAASRPAPANRVESAQGIWARLLAPFRRH